MMISEISALTKQIAKEKDAKKKADLDKSKPCWRQTRRKSKVRKNGL